jgi:hypothetical protein
MWIGEGPVTRKPMHIGTDQRQHGTRSRDVGNHLDRPADRLAAHHALTGAKVETRPALVNANPTRSHPILRDARVDGALAPRRYGTCIRPPTGGCAAPRPVAHRSEGA